MRQNARSNSSPSSCLDFEPHFFWIPISFFNRFPFSMSQSLSCVSFAIIAIFHVFIHRIWKCHPPNCITIMISRSHHFGTFCLQWNPLQLSGIFFFLFLISIEKKWKGYANYAIPMHTFYVDFFFILFSFVFFSSFLFSLLAK